MSHTFNFKKTALFLFAFTLYCKTEFDTQSTFYAKFYSFLHNFTLKTQLKQFKSLHVSVCFVIQTAPSSTPAVKLVYCVLSYMFFSFISYIIDQYRTTVHGKGTACKVKKRIFVSTFF